MFSDHVDQELEQISKELDALLSDQEAIATAVEGDPNLKLCGGDVHAGAASTDELVRKESTLALQLHELKQFAAVAGLVREFDACFARLEVDRCYDSLQKLHRKLSLMDLSRQSMLFQQSLAVHMDSLHLKLVRKIQEMLDQFWQIAEDRLAFQKRIAADDANRGPEHECGCEYESLVLFVKEHLCPDGFVDSRSWFVATVSMEDCKEDVCSTLSLILTSYIRLTPVVDTLKSFLFRPNTHIVREASALVCKPGLARAEEVLDSFRQVASYLSDVTVPADSSTILSAVGNTMATELLKCVKQYSRELSQDAVLKAEVLEINGTLESLSRRENSAWSYEGSKISSLVNDEQSYVNLLVDKLLQQQIGRIREAFKDKSWSELHSAEAQTHALGGAQDDTAAKAQEPKDEWAWGEGDDDGEDEDDGDGWGDSASLNLDDEETQEAHSTVSREVAEGWDEAWDDELDLDTDKDGTTAGHAGITHSHAGPNSIQVTKIPALFESVLADFEKGCDEIGRDKIGVGYAYKTNVLHTSFMAMCMCKYAQWWQLANDVSYIVCKNTGQDLSGLRDLSYRLVDTHTNNMKKAVYNMISRKLKNLAANDLDRDQDIVARHLLPYVNDVVYPALLALHDDFRLLSFVEFLYTTCIEDQILGWHAISERNSENLARLVGQVLDGTQLAILQDNVRYKELRERLAVVSKVLIAHLTEIMDMFYNGDFYIFSTDEIVQWIVLLFADTGLRRDCIDEVRRIREESEY